MCEAAAYLRLAPRLRKRGVLPPSHGSMLKHREKFTFYPSFKKLNNPFLWLNIKLSLLCFAAYLKY
jgi:hypothetical protein